MCSTSARARLSFSSSAAKPGWLHQCKSGAETARGFRAPAEVVITAPATYTSRRLPAMDPGYRTRTLSVQFGWQPRGPKPSCIATWPRHSSNMRNELCGGSAASTRAFVHRRDPVSATPTSGRYALPVKESRNKDPNLLTLLDELFCGARRRLFDDQGLARKKTAR